MELVKSTEGIYITQDDAKIIFSGKEPPQKIFATIIGKTSFNTEEKIEVELENLRYLSTVSADVELKKMVPWGSNSTYSFYLETAKDRVVIVQFLSGINKFFYVDQAGMVVCLLSMLGSLQTSEVWSICECIVGTYEKCYLFGVKQGGKQYKQAFIEGRLKKRKESGTDNYNVWIESKNDR